MAALIVALYIVSVVVVERREENNEKTTYTHILNYGLNKDMYFYFVVKK